METNRQTGQHPGYLLWERVRHLVTAQPGLFGLALVLVVYAGLNFPQLGGHGLWDPWEMDRAHVARQMTGAPRVLVVERREKDEALGPVARWLNLRYQGNLVVVTGEPSKGAKASIQTELDRARKVLDEQVVHFIIVDASLAVQDSGSHPQVETLLTWLRPVRLRNRGAHLIVLSPLTGDPAEVEAWQERLKRTYAEVGVELAGRELVGKTWGKPGVFRRELIKVLRDAGKTGYQPVAELSTPNPENFQDRAFWEAAEKAGLDQRMNSTVPADVLATLAENSPIATVPVMPWPRGADYDACLHDFATGEQTAGEAAMSATANLEAALDKRFDAPYLRAQFKQDGYTRSVPPLDFWLMAGSFSVLGFSEMAARLPAFLLGLLALFLVFRMMRPVWGPAAATFAGLVLATSPLFFGQARSAAGEMTFLCALLVITAALLRMSHEGRLTRSGLAFVIMGGIVGFFSQGLFGLVVPAGLAVAYCLVAADRRFSAIIPTAALLVLLGMGFALVHTGDGWTFWQHFTLESPLFNWKMTPDDRTVRLNFDVLVRQIGFGMMPWAVLLPFGLGLLVYDRVQGSDRPAMLLVLAFFVPYVLQSLLFKGHNHLVFPAAPAAAAVVGILLARALAGRSLGTITGVVSALLMLVLISNTGKTAEPLTSWLTTDPPLGGSETASAYPEDLKLPKAIKYALMAIAGLLMLFGARAASRVRKVVCFFSNNKPFAVATIVLLVCLAIRLLYGLESQIAASFTTQLGQTLETVHRLYVRSVFYWRPDRWALEAGVILSGVGLLWWHTSVTQRFGRWLASWILTGFTLRWAGALTSLGVTFAAASASEALGSTGFYLGSGLLVGLFVGLAFRRPMATWHFGAVGLGLSAVVFTGLHGAGPPLFFAVLGLVLTALPLPFEHKPAVLPAVRAAILDAVRWLLLQLHRGWAPVLIGGLFGLGTLIFAGVSLELEFRPWLLALYVPVLFLPLFVLMGPRKQLLASAGIAVGFFGSLVALSLYVMGHNSLAYYGIPVPLPEALHEGAAGVMALPWVILSGLLLVSLSARGTAKRGTTAFYLLHGFLVTQTGLIALGALVYLGRFQPGFIRWATIESPLFRVGVVFTVLIPVLAVADRFAGRVLFAETSLLAWLRGLGRPGPAIVSTLVAFAFTVGITVTQIFLESGLTAVDLLIIPEARPFGSFVFRNQGFAICGLLVLMVVLLFNAAIDLLRERPRVSWLAFTGLFIVSIGNMVSSLSRKWMQLEPAVQADGAEPFLPYLFRGSRTTQIFYLGLAALGLIYLARRIPWVLECLRTRRATVETCVLLGLVALAALVTWQMGRIPMLVGLGAMGVALGGGIVLLLNTFPEALRRAAARLRHPVNTLYALAFILALAVGGRIGLVGGVLALLGPAIALALRFSPLGRPAAPRLGTGQVNFDGDVQILFGWLAFAVPSVLAWALGLASASLLLHGLIALVGLILVWGLASLMRLGLGIADIMERLAVVTPTAFFFALLVAAELLFAQRDATPGLTGKLTLALGAVLLLLVVFNFAANFLHPLRILELFERPRVFVVALAVSASGFAFLFNTQLVTALSFHVSQKHIIDTVIEASDGDHEGRLFQLGLGKSAGSSRNFYTREIPEVSDTKGAIKAMVGAEDVVLPVKIAAASGEDYVVVRGFSETNDINSDGARDFRADTGFISAVNIEEGWFEDAKKAWKTDAWRTDDDDMYFVIDSDGWKWIVERNTARRVYWRKDSAIAPEHIAAKSRRPAAPRFDKYASARNHYVIDNARALNHRATGMTRERIFFLLPKIGDHTPDYADSGSFSDINHRFREQSGGVHLPVLDDRSSRILLATGWLESDEDDKNWLRKVTLTDADFLELVKDGAIRGFNKKRPLEGVINWEDKFKLLGYSMTPFAVSKGKKFTIRTYFKVTHPVKDSLKIFMHLDRDGHRIHTDHWPHAVSQGEKGKHCIGCFQTNHWREGDIVVDEFTRDVPYGAPPGETGVWMGLFNPRGDKRLKIISWNDKIVKYGGNDDRARIGSFDVR